MVLSAGTGGGWKPDGRCQSKLLADWKASAEAAVTRARPNKAVRFRRDDSVRFAMCRLLRFLAGMNKEFIRLWDTLLLMRMDSAKSVMAFRLRCVVLASLMLVSLAGWSQSAFATPPDAAAPPAVLKVEGAVTTPLSLTAEDLDKMPRSTATLTADGNTTTYEGVLLYDILVKAGWQFGRGMTGKGMASYVIATAKDGYQVVFALAEIDPMFGGAKVMIADKADGATLPATQQPFRVVAPGDKMHARSIYSLLKIEVVRLRP